MPTMSDVAETLAAIVATPEDEKRLGVEAEVIVQTDNGLHEADPLEQPTQENEVQS